MAKQEHLRFRKGDFLAIAAVVLIAVFVAVGFLPNQNGGAVQAEVSIKGSLSKPFLWRKNLPLNFPGITPM